MLDFSQPEKKEYPVIDEGTYELLIELADFKTPKDTTKKKYISLKLVVRDDVEQKFQGAVLWANIYENDVYRLDDRIISAKRFNELSDSDKARVVVTKEYNNFSLRNLLNAQDADEENKKLKFKNYEEIVLFLNGMKLRGKVKKYYDERQDKDRNDLDFDNLSRTLCPKAQIVKQNDTTVDLTGLNERNSDFLDDLPF